METATNLTDERDADNKASRTRAKLLASRSVAAARTGRADNHCTSSR
jgi:hypothetical protein